MPRGVLQFSTDWVWGGAGLSLATASASFAGYMILTAPAQVTGFGSKDFNVFVHWDRRNPAMAALHAPPGGGMPVAPDKPVAAAAALQTAAATPPPTAQAIDFTPTGTIPDGAGISQEARAAGPLDAYRLRNVVGDRALIEHQSRLMLVKPGSILAGAGEVLSIERRGGGWIVRTASGVIGGS